MINKTLGLAKEAKFPSQMKLIYLVFVSLLISGWFYWFQWRPEKYLQKRFLIVKTCEQNIFNRPNELNYEWAEGKQWMPIPDEPYGKYEHGWLYSDQSYRLKTRAKTQSFDECLKKE